VAAKYGIEILRPPGIPAAFTQPAVSRQIATLEAEAGPDGPRRRVLIATNGCLSRAPAVAPMKAILRRVAEEHCFTCNALITR
jgi:hypothetical protein